MFICAVINIVVESWREEGVREGEGECREKVGKVGRMESLKKSEKERRSRITLLLNAYFGIWHWHLRDDRSCEHQCHYLDSPKLYFQSQCNQRYPERWVQSQDQSRQKIGVWHLHIIKKNDNCKLEKFTFSATAAATEAVAETFYAKNSSHFIYSHTHFINWNSYIQKSFLPVKIKKSISAAKNSSMTYTSLASTWYCCSTLSLFYYQFSWYLCTQKEA